MVVEVLMVVMVSDGDGGEFGLLFFAGTAKVTQGNSATPRFNEIG